MPDFHAALRPKPSSRSHAFSLLEVLVVISVIALLVALLVPSLARNRERARTVICQSNLKEWGRAMMMYADDHRGSLPFENRPKTPADQADPDRPWGPVEDADGDRVWDATGWICWFDVLDKYLGASPGAEAHINVKTCPTVSRGDPNIEESYRMNSKLAEHNPESPYYMPFRKLDTLKRPAQTILLFDGDVGGSTISFKGRWRHKASSDSKGDDVNYRHNRQANFLFTDWHVEIIKKKAVSKRSYYNEPMVWQPADMGPWDPSPRK